MYKGVKINIHDVVFIHVKASEQNKMDFTKSHPYKYIYTHLVHPLGHAAAGSVNSTSGYMHKGITNKLQENEYYFLAPKYCTIMQHEMHILKDCKLSSDGM